MALVAACAAQAQPVDAGVSAPVAAALSNEPGARPRLVVVLSIDQFRADYLTRLGDLFCEGGFKRLMGGGAWFVNAEQGHYPLFTGPGHAALLTGGSPYKTGIVSNEWWDPVAKRLVYCVDEPRAKVVGAAEGSGAKPMGPRNLKSTTLGDELKLATAGRSRGVSIAIKDRASILMGGHAADVCLWYDPQGGRWISSSAYCKGGELPAWVRALNDENLPGKTLGTVWTCGLSDEVVKERTKVPRVTGKHMPEGFGVAFPHAVMKEPTAANYKAFIYTPDANAFVFTTAERAVVEERLGQRGVPDVLTLNLSTNDYVGHAFEPYSAESVDLVMRTDAQLAGFMRFLDEKVGAGKVLFVLTADHGVSPMPEDAGAPEIGVNALRYSVKDVVSCVSDALTARYGEPAGGSWYSLPEGAKPGDGSLAGGTFLHEQITLSREAVGAVLMSRKAESRRDIERVACDAVNGAGIPGVYGCFGKTQILEGRVADNDLGHHLMVSVHPQVSADLLLLQEQLCLQDPMAEGYATSHGTVYAYDTHVPVIVYQPGLIRAGVFTQRVSPIDIAPTISLLVGVEFPSGCDGQPLAPALAK